MLDPITSLSLASGIITLVDFGAKCIKNAREIAEYGCTEEQRHLRIITSDLISVSSDITNQIGSSAVHGLAQQTQDVAQELSQMLAKVQIDDQDQNQPRLGKRKRIVKNLMYTAWRKDDINKMEKHLSDLRQQMVLRLSLTQSQSLSDVLNRLSVPGQKVYEEQTALLGQLEKYLKSTQTHGIELKPSDAGGDQDVLSCLAGLIDQGRTITRCQHILKSLEFEGLYAREQMIPVAHQSTFTWILKEKRHGFVDWASHQNGIFWMTGKPGSGKSTLMKYLIREPETRKLLRQWAGTRRLGVASHYFWNSGTTMQKSEEGLLQKLLYDIVCQFPAEALKAIPAEFTDAKVLGNVPWTVDDLRKVLEAFGQNEDLDTKFCFFIDGLDEYRSDHGELVECLSRLSRCPSIKLCVSSRPWNVFTQAYNNRAQGQLAVHELTRADIRKMVEDRMSTSEAFRALQVASPQAGADIVAEICDKAQGVFLWVHLVLRSLLRGMNDNDDDIDILRERVRECPDTLDGYFDRMFQRIEKVYKKQSARILLVALAVDGPLPIRAPSFIGEELKNSDYAQNMRLFSVGGSQEISHKCDKNRSSTRRVPTLQGRSISMIKEALSGGEEYEIQKARRYLDARCGDLLEVNIGTITFLHRTARDFLERDDMADSIRRIATDDFDTHLSLARLSLAQLKSVWPNRSEELEILLKQVLGAENKILNTSKSKYADVLEDIDQHGVALFDAQDRIAGRSFGGNSHVPQERVKYEDSVDFIKIHGALVRMGRCCQALVH
ncbi:unnamed protein product [Periconia digitata]|uniref:NACHT domain-containing protein n=1 Tax=Periconia digitata TaxID=1303443 RepID=A0A9W4U9F1_9PLEO|nr:unnamed protein product [Periconia digitata]